MPDPKDDALMEEVLHQAERAAHRDPDEANIAADDAGGTLLAQEMEAEEEERGRPN